MSLCASYDNSDDSCYDYNDTCDFGGPSVAAALAIYRDLRRTGAVKGQITKEIFQALEDREFIRLGCARQSKGLLLGHIGHIPDPGVRQDLMVLLARYAAQGDLREVTLRLNISDSENLKSIIPDFVRVFPRKSLSKVTLQVIAKGGKEDEKKAWNHSSNFLLLWFAQFLRHLVQVAENELLISVECDESLTATTACVNLLRVLQSCRTELPVDCNVRVFIYGGRLNHNPGIPASVSSCCNVLNDLRLQSSSAFTLKSLAGLLRSTNLATSDSRLRDLSVFSILHNDQDVEMFCAALAECLYDPLTTLECLDFYSGLSFDVCVMSDHLGQSLATASRLSTAFCRGKSLRRLRFDASGYTISFWRRFCRDVLPHLRVQCLSIYNARWSTKLYEVFKKGLEANLYVGELELVFLKGARAQFFRRDRLSLQRYLRRNHRMHQVWDMVKLTYENKHESFATLLEKLTELNKPKNHEGPADGPQEQDIAIPPLDFTYHLVRDALVTYVVSI